MTFINFNDNLRASYCLALEEYIMNNPSFEDEYFLLWRDKPSVIIGRYQNTLKEINKDYVNKNGINIVRRPSGGGAVYHDLGGIQFSFITHRNTNKTTNEENNNHEPIAKFSMPIVEALHKMGLEVQFSGRNDLMFQGKKFSGNAKYSNKTRNLHHGTILYDTDLDALVNSLNVTDDKITSKGVQSVRERVTNIKPHLRIPEMTPAEFKEVLEQQVAKQMKTISLTEEDIKKVIDIEKNKFLTWRWTFGEDPDFDIATEKKFENGKIELYIEVKNGTINGFDIRGDFFFDGDIEPFKKLFIDTRYDNEEIRERIKQYWNEPNTGFQNIAIDDFMELF